MACIDTGHSEVVQHQKEVNHLYLCHVTMYDFADTKNSVLDVCILFLCLCWPSGIPVLYHVGSRYTGWLQRNKWIIQLQFKTPKDEKGFPGLEFSKILKSKFWLKSRFLANHIAQMSDSSKHFRLKDSRELWPMAYQTEARILRWRPCAMDKVDSAWTGPGSGWNSAGTLAWQTRTGSQPLLLSPSVLSSRLAEIWNKYFKVLSAIRQPSGVDYQLFKLFCQIYSK